MARMRRDERASGRRGFIAIIAASALLAAVAVPAFAEQGTAGIPLPPPPPQNSDQTSDSGAGSTDGFANVSDVQAEALFTNSFSATVDSLASDPPDLSGQHPVFLDNHTAVVSPAASPVSADDIAAVLNRDQHDVAAAQADLENLLGQQDQGANGPSLISSVLPLRANGGSGLSPVDLSLDQQGSGYVADNPLVEARLPGTLGGDVSVGDQGIQLDVGGDAAATADPIDGGEALFYADAAPATDAILAPISTGVETFYELRAPESPEHFRLGFSLPAGAQLSQTGDGATIVSDGETLGAIYPPTATDAAGNPVNVQLSVDGNDLVLEVPHSDPGIRYPISVDPVVDVYTWSTNGAGRFADWVANQTPGSPYMLRTTCVSGVNCQNGTAPTGLYVETPANSAVTNPSSAAWQYTVPHYPSTSAFISQLDLGPMNFTPRSDTNANPFMFAGVYSDNSSSYLASASQSTAASNLYWSLDPPTYATSGQKAVFSQWSWVNRTVTAWRDAYLGGASVSVGDTETPSLTNVTHTGISIGQADWSYSNWVDNATPSVSVTAADGGLGVKSLMVPQANGSLHTVSENCDGTSASPCPQHPGTVTGNYDTSQMPSGANITGVLATDAVDKSASRTFVVRVDHSAPTVSVSGSLANPSGSAPYALHIEAQDGNANDSSGAQWQSGVKSIDVFIDGEQVASTSQGCPGTAASCPLSLDYTLQQPYDFAGSSPEIDVTATDQLGHSQTLDWTHQDFVSIPSAEAADASEALAMAQSEAQALADQGSQLSANAANMSDSSIDDSYSEGDGTFLDLSPIGGGGPSSTCNLHIYKPWKHSDKGHGKAKNSGCNTSDILGGSIATCLSFVHSDGNIETVDCDKAGKAGSANMAVHTKQHCSNHGPRAWIVTAAGVVQYDTGTSKAKGEHADILHCVG